MPKARPVGTGKHGPQVRPDVVTIPAGRRSEQEHRPLAVRLAGADAASGQLVTPSRNLADAQEIGAPATRAA
jgi:hypothetical protein